MSLLPAQYRFCNRKYVWRRCSLSQIKLLRRAMQAPPQMLWKHQPKLALVTSVLIIGRRNGQLFPLPSTSSVGARFCCLHPKVVSSFLFCRHWVDTLLALLGSSWDRSRALAYSILARFPRPLTGYEGLDGATCLAAQGLRLSNSGRQRESDRGALVLRLVFGSYARGLGLRVPLLATEVGNMCRQRGGTDGLTSGGAEGGDAAAGFLEELCGVLTHRCFVLEVTGFRRADTLASVKNCFFCVDSTPICESQPCPTR